MKKLKNSALILVVLLAFASCSNPTNESKDSNANEVISETQNETSDVDTANPQSNKGETTPKTDEPKVLIYSFHLTNRCPSCIAIEDATKKTLNTYFKEEQKSGRIKLSILNVDDEANAKIAEKYEASGSGLFVTRVFKGKESTTDLTGDGFKFARNKEDKFIEILKTTIENYLK